ncbi:MAG: class I SAM-dependent methyltransferase [Clostridia bacterium]|nr:class I SAM-dependent methyltransferase [Clostridia bacterium]
MFLADGWREYRVFDASRGEKLEDWNGHLLIRPDPQVIWDTPRTDPRWAKAEGHYKRSSTGGGHWEGKLPERWLLHYKDLTFQIKPMGFKHTGVFPEQAYNWDFCRRLIEGAGREISVLNLFAYTGGATLACAKSGARLCHVDAAKGMVAAAKENAALSGLADAPIRYIVDDCKKFVEREIRRGRKYDAVIMDPPSYGRGPTGEIWKLEEAIHPLLQLITGVLSDNPLFVLVNSYTTGLSPTVMACLLGKTVRPLHGGRVVADELGLPMEDGLTLPCGGSAYWLPQNVL